MDQEIDERFLRRALDLAVRGPEADPNPRVGCVIVRDGDVVAEGWHQGAGTPHAEAMALSALAASTRSFLARSASRDDPTAERRRLPMAERAERDEARHASRGADQALTAYVTLEPCAHTGRTGPCAQALLDAGVARVVYAQADPNPVAAGGAAVLRAGGVDVVAGLLADEATALNRTWTHRVVTGRPFVTWKYAATLDGRSAALDGTSQWITSPESRADVGQRRARCGAIVVGTGTVLADDPRLTARRPDGTLLPTQPLRVVVGASPLPASARVLDDATPTLLLTTRSPAEVLDELAARGIHHVWLEGGPTLAAAWLRAGAVDEVLAYVAPALLGSGPAAVADLGVVTIADAVRLGLTDVARVGPDVRLTLAPTPTQPNQPTKED